MQSTVQSLRTGKSVKCKADNQISLNFFSSDWKQVQENLKEIVIAMTSELLQPKENELIERSD